ncbi:MAG TPA: hypothetical protein VIM10_11440 [Actinopolymorphaceae bacterium]|jgi:hypothetical protein
MTFGLDTTDGTTGDLSGFVEAGITAELSVVLTAHDLHPQPCPNTEARLRMLASDDDWAQAVDLRMGLDDTLVHHAGRYALTDLGVETLVIVADPEYVATRIYRSVGFDGTETRFSSAVPEPAF